jgi:hypothetical protein
MMMMMSEIISLDTEIMYLLGLIRKFVRIRNLLVSSNLSRMKEVLHSLYKIFMEDYYTPTVNMIKNYLSQVAHDANGTKLQDNVFLNADTPIAKAQAWRGMSSEVWNEVFVLPIMETL